MGFVFATDITWQEATNWLNEIGNITERTKITATLEDNANHDGIKWEKEKCITVEMKKIK